MIFKGKLCLWLCLVATFCFIRDIKGETSIVTRKEWNAKPTTAEMTPLELPVSRIIVAHTAGNECSRKEACSQEMRIIQNFHMTKGAYDDIAYNYLVGNDGNVYEGRGWRFQGAIARGINAGSISIAFMGVFTKNLPSLEALNAAKSLIVKLQTDQKLKEDYKLFGHRQMSPTLSPGDALYAEIQKWPKWSNDI
ncbi:peptidoglycan-recognition protein SD [Stomoxys calcitrans]|uniref:Peptidoglycan-recognition protein n=1 Tax=Stomoxys calcitrans TaxID=35570 RepID=A0A1I8P3S8_STOCA|nr:peptidoglycan-recognition protein SD [Stomoxys calcitrans]